jgi:fructose-bisphosphate aldolase class I
MVNQASAFSVGGTFLSAVEKAALEETAAAVATPGKGITACDESPGTIGNRFEKVGVENTEENRRRYRQMLFEAPGCEDYLSAAILDPEVHYLCSVHYSMNLILYSSLP